MIMKKKTGSLGTRLGIEYLDVTAFNPLTVGLNSTKPLIITKNSFLQLLYAHFQQQDSGGYMRLL